MAVVLIVDKIRRCDWWKPSTFLKQFGSNTLVPGVSCDLRNNSNLCELVNNTRHDVLRRSTAGFFHVDAAIDQFTCAGDDIGFNFDWITV
jgi:hypothetical protein